MRIQEGSNNSCDFIHPVKPISFIFSLPKSRREFEQLLETHGSLQMLQIFIATHTPNLEQL